MILHQKIFCAQKSRYFFPERRAIEFWRKFYDSAKPTLDLKSSLMICGYVMDLKTDPTEIILAFRS